MSASQSPSSSFSPSPEPINKSVRFIYLIPSDRQFNQSYYDALVEVAEGQQDFFGKQLTNGTTFKLNTPIVEVEYSTRNAAWFDTGPLNFHQNAWQEYADMIMPGVVNNLPALGNNDNYKYVIQVDAEDTSVTFGGIAYSVGGSICSVTSSVGSTFFEDLINGSAQSIANNKKTMAHELGHLFGLDHAPQDNSVMSGVTGFFPDVFFRSTDLDILRNDEQDYFIEDYDLPSTPTFFGSGIASGSTGNISPSLPTGWLENDIFLLFIETANQDVNTPSGWTKIDNLVGVGTAGTSNAAGVVVFWKRATSSESAPTVTGTVDHKIGIIFAIRGCITTDNPIEFSTTSTDATVTTNAFSLSGGITVNPDCLVVAVITAVGITNYSNGRISGWTNTNLATLHNHVLERFDAGVSVGVGGWLGIATATKENPGIVGNTTGIKSQGLFTDAGIVFGLRGEVGISESSSSSPSSSESPSISPSVSPSASQSPSSSISPSEHQSASVSPSESLSLSPSSSVSPSSSRSPSSSISPSVSPSASVSPSFTFFELSLDIDYWRIIGPIQLDVDYWALGPYVLSLDVDYWNPGRSGQLRYWNGDKWIDVDNIT